MNTEQKIQANLEQKIQDARELVEVVETSKTDPELAALVHVLHEDPALVNLTAGLGAKTAIEVARFAAGLVNSGHSAINATRALADKKREAMDDAKTAVARARETAEQGRALLERVREQRRQGRNIGTVDEKIIKDIANLEREASLLEESIAGIEREDALVVDGDRRDVSMLHVHNDDATLERFRGAGLTNLPAPRVGREYMAAVHSHQRAVELLGAIERSPSVQVSTLRGNFALDSQILKKARPFFWADEPTAAVRALAQKIPTDAQLNEWNLDTLAAWWHFEHGLPIKTTNDGAPLQALCLGWVENMFVVCCWNRLGPEEAEKLRGATREQASRVNDILPSQVWCWHAGETLGQMLERIRREHWTLYGPAGKWRREANVGEEVFMKAAEDMSRFILGALLWLNQKLPVLQRVEQPIERHERKRYQKALKTDEKVGVRVVQLRKREVNHDPPDPNAPKSHREYSCRWVVEGHVRNARVGPGRQERKLIWIDAYEKGPEDKPFRAAPTKVYEVRR